MYPQDWLGVVRPEYLETFIAAGGGVVRFLVPTTRDDSRQVCEGLRAAGDELVDRPGLFPDRDARTVVDSD